VIVKYEEKLRTEKQVSELAEFKYTYCSYSFIYCICPLRFRLIYIVTVEQILINYQSFLLPNVKINKLLRSFHCVTGTILSSNPTLQLHVPGIWS